MNHCTKTQINKENHIKTKKIIIKKTFVTKPKLFAGCAASILFISSGAFFCLEFIGSLTGYRGGFYLSLSVYPLFSLFLYSIYFWIIHFLNFSIAKKRIYKGFLMTIIVISFCEYFKFYDVGLIPLIAIIVSSLLSLFFCLEYDLSVISNNKASQEEKDKEILKNEFLDWKLSLETCFDFLAYTD